MIEKLSAGAKGEKELINSPALKKKLRKANENAEKKRNKKKIFLCTLLFGDFKSDSSQYGEAEEIGTRWIYVIERLRKRCTKLAIDYPAFEELLSEWQEQSQNPQTNDTLTQIVMSVGKVPIAFRCFAINSHCKRLRSGSGLINENAELARKLAQDSKRTLETFDWGDSEKNFSMIPSMHFWYEISLQKLLTEARFGDIDEIYEEAEKLEGVVKNDKSLREYSHRPDQLILFWIYLTKMRCAAVCSNEKLWIQAREDVASLIENSPLKGHLEYQRQRSTHKRGDALVERTSIYKRIKHINELLHHLKEVEIYHDKDFKYKRSRNQKSKNDREATIDATSRYTRLTNSFNDFNQLSHHYPKYQIPKSVKHNYSTTVENRRKKANRLIAESYAAIQSICLANNFHTVHLLDLYHRTLIYRLWWESLDYSGEELFDRKKLFFILRKISVEIEDRSEKLASGILKNLDKTIEKIRQGQANWLSQLQDIIEDWRAEPAPENAHSTVLGVIYCFNTDEPEQPMDPHQFLDPMMPAIGPAIPDGSE